MLEEDLDGGRLGGESETEEARVDLLDIACVDTDVRMDVVPVAMLEVTLPELEEVLLTRVTVVHAVPGVVPGMGVAVVGTLMLGVFGEVLGA